jgi:hypothetical protein
VRDDHPSEGSRSGEKRKTAFRKAPKQKQQKADTFQVETS